MKPFFSFISRVTVVETSEEHTSRRGRGSEGRIANGDEQERTFDEVSDRSRCGRVGPHGGEVGKTNILVNVEDLLAGLRSGDVARDREIPAAQNAELARVVPIGQRIAARTDKDVSDGGQRHSLIGVLDVDEQEGTLGDSGRRARKDAATDGNRTHGDALANSLIRRTARGNCVHQDHGRGWGRIRVEVEGTRLVNSLALSNAATARRTTLSQLKASHGADASSCATLSFDEKRASRFAARLLQSITLLAHRSRARTLDGDTNTGRHFCRSKKK